MNVNVWTCDMDENNDEVRCTNTATRIITWYDEGHVERDHAGVTMKLCEDCFQWAKHGVWETPAVLDVGTALIGPRSRRPHDPNPAPIRPTSCAACQMKDEPTPQDAVAVIALDKTHGLLTPNANPDETDPIEVCGRCLAEFARIAGVDIKE